VAERLDLPGARILGPAPLFRLKGRERAQLLIKAGAGERATAVRAVRQAVESVSADKAHRDASYSVDVDPQ
jgi:primosomal protein N' (replication factor Y)